MIFREVKRGPTLELQFMRSGRYGLWVSTNILIEHV